MKEPNLNDLPAEQREEIAHILAGSRHWTCPKCGEEYTLGGAITWEACPECGYGVRPVRPGANREA